MKKIEQTKFGLEGNCFQASVASLLEIPIEEVPAFDGDPGSSSNVGDCHSSSNAWSDYLYQLNTEFLAPRGIYVVNIIDLAGDKTPMGYSILSFSAVLELADGDMGMTVGHSVVCHDGVIVWNPDPKSRGAEILHMQPLYWTVFCLCDPAETYNDHR